MRCLKTCLCLLLALSACHKPLFDTYPRGMHPLRQESWPEPATEEADSAVLDVPLDKGLYLTAVRFPDWANWREGDFRGAEAVLFRDTVQVLAVPAGPRPDADRLRLWGGHLWTDRADAGETILYCDGVERLRYPGEELLRGFLVHDGSVHTLGQRPGGAGFSYRIDGEEVFSTPEGMVMGSPGQAEWEGGALMRDSTGVYYVYSIPFRQGTERLWEYRVMRGDQLVKLFPAKRSDGKIFDIRVFDGVVWRCERRNSSGQSLCLAKDDLYLALDMMAGEEVLQARLVPLDGAPAIKGVSEMDAGDRLYWLRTQAGLRLGVRRQDIQAFYYDQGAVSYVTASHDGTVITLMKNFVFMPVEPCRFRLLGERCGAFTDGSFAVALTAVEGTSHQAVIDGKTLPFTFNGYFTSLWIE